jgi:hypothetical protein
LYWLLALLLVAAPALLLLLRLRSPPPALATLLSWTLFGGARLLRLLLELADLPFHESTRLLVLTLADLVETTVGAAFPTLGIGVLTGRAENGFRQGHR